MTQRLSDWLRERQLSAARLEAEIAEARLRFTTIASQPEKVLRILERLADEVLVDPVATEQALAQLADQLRRTLEASLSSETTLAGHP